MVGGEKFPTVGAERIHQNVNDPERPFGVCPHLTVGIRVADIQPFESGAVHGDVPAQPLDDAIFTDHRKRSTRGRNRQIITQRLDSAAARDRGWERHRLNVECIKIRADEWIDAHATPVFPRAGDTAAVPEIFDPDIPNYVSGAGLPCFYNIPADIGDALRCDAPPIVQYASVVGVPEPEFDHPLAVFPISQGVDNFLKMAFIVDIQIEFVPPVASGARFLGIDQRRASPR